MNKILDIDSEEDRAAAIAVLAKAPLPLVIEVRVGEKRRSLSQNAAYRSLIGDIATLTGHERSELHRHFGRRLLDFEADTVGGLEALVPRSTRSLSHAEMGELIENVQCIAAWLGMDPVSADAENWDGGDVEGSGNETKDQALSCALTQIYNAFGDEALMSMDGEAIGNVEAVSTGSIGLDLALGVGGLARGRLHELYGGESSGKTTLALHAIARVQKQGGTAAFIDAEHALDLNYAVRLGVDIDQLLVSQPDDGEQALDITDTLVRCGAVDIIVVDSVAALTPRAEIAGEMGAAQSGLQARLMSQALRRLTANVKRSNSVVLFLNQTRARIGSAYANPGGHALKFYATSRIEISRTAAIKEGGAVVGNTTKVKVVKNKLSPPFRQAEFDLLYGDGVSREGELIDLGLQAAVVAKSGGWYNYDGQPLGQRKENARRFLKERPEIAEEIASSIEAAHGSGQATRTTKQEIAHRGAGSLREVNAA